MENIMVLESLNTKMGESIMGCLSEEKGTEWLDGQPLQGRSDTNIGLQTR